VAVGDAITGADAIGEVTDGSPATGASATGAVAVGEEQLELELTQLVQGKMERQQLELPRRLNNPSDIFSKLGLSRLLCRLKYIIKLLWEKMTSRCVTAEPQP